jgi:hypothetical protein
MLGTCTIHICIWLQGGVWFRRRRWWKLLDKDYDLDLEDEDVLVFLHMQKTGGTTFGKHLVKNLDVDQPCECSKGLFVTFQ